MKRRDREPSKFLEAWFFGNNELERLGRSESRDAGQGYGMPESVGLLL